VKYLGKQRNARRSIVWGAVVAAIVIIGTVGVMVFYHASPTYNPKLGWIEFDFPGGRSYYVVTNQTCIPVNPLASIGWDTQGGGIIANVLPNGTKTYSIKGINRTKAFAVALVNGKYVKAVYVGSDQPH
jgi:hypothetical protein